MKMPKAVRLPSGSWRVQVRFDDKVHSVTEPTEELAQATAVALRAGLIAQRDAPKGSLTLTEAITAYIENRRNVLSPATIAGYKGIQKYRFQSLMKKQVQKITEADLQIAINEEAKTKSAKTISNGIGLVHAVIADYKEINSKRLRYPQRIRKEHKFLDAGQLVELIDACRGDIAEIPILMAAWLGLRRSEIFGLQWGSVDFAGKTLMVENAYVRGEEGVFALKPEMKNEKSRRRIDCPEYILEKLRAYQPDEKKRVGTVLKIHPETAYKNLKKICERSGIEFVGVHGLRHTNASVMLSLGIVDKVAMARGGWATDNIMKSVYQHLFDSDKQNADASINAFFDGLVEKSHTKSHTVENGT